MLYSIYLKLLQLPPGTQNPDDNTPVDFTNPFDLIVFIILPVVLIVFYIFWRKKAEKK